jgi:hypothetical protein
MQVRLSNNDETVIVKWGRREEVTMGNYNRLDSGWLNDECVNWGMQWVYALLQSTFTTHLHQ